MINTPKHALNTKYLQTQTGRNVTFSRFWRFLTQIPIRKRTYLYLYFQYAKIQKLLILYINTIYLFIIFHYFTIYQNIILRILIQLWCI